MQKSHPESAPLHVVTPVWRSVAASQSLGCEVLLKMEALQPVGSFKLRGIGRACQRKVAAGARALMSSSGGNAGLAVAYAGRRLAVPVEVLVPETTPESMRARIRAEGATVVEHGTAWDDAHARALELAAGRGVAYIHPFDDPEIWAGHATLVDELATELDGPPDAVVVAVGGGGLLIGVLEGLHDAGWTGVPVLAVETEGAASLAAAVAAGAPVTLPRIDSVATSLGARTVAPAALTWCGRHDVRSVVVADRQAVAACVRIADEHRVLVEPACGAALAVAYDGAAALREVAPAGGCVVVVCCGGAGVSLELLARWQAAVSGARGPR